ncbi:MAG: protein kinase [Acidobacteria bacterium]|nr:protein kinase [Acidobacteriota bacterium]
MLTGQQLGKYEIRSKIGEGGMGEVYSAHDAELGRSVAIKLLPTEFTTDDDRKARFRQEARVVSALNHPNIITIYEIGEDDNGSFLATEFVEGRTLREVIKKGSMTLPRILRIAEQTANALVAAHAADIVHRDIKPENIMVRHDSIVKVLDFGLAKPNEQIIISGDTESNRTVPGTIMGSARYMSPEQARGQDVDGRTDIWSLGVVLYEMLTGTVPFDGETTTDTLAAVIYKEPEPLWHILPNAPPELQRIIRKSLQKDREERYQDVKDFALDLKELLYEIEHANSGSRSAHTTSSPNFSENPTIIHRTISGDHSTVRSVIVTSYQSAQASRKRPRFAMLALPVLAILLLVLGGYAFYSWSTAERPLAAAAFVRPQISRINTDGRVLLPAISPDGKYVAYVSGEFGRRSLVVRQIATDSLVTVVPPTNLNLQSITFSPTGDYIYYCQTSTDFSINTLYQVPTLGGTPKKLIEDVDSPVTFSPDGKQFAFVRHRSEPNEDVIFVADTATLAIEPLISNRETPYNFFAFRLAWSPDGKMLLAGAGKRQSGFVANTDVVEISIDEKKVRPLNQREFFDIKNVVWFADGSGFVFSGRESQNGPNQIWRAAYPSGETEQITNDFNDYLELSVSADGRNIVTVKGDTVSSVWRYSPASKKNTQLTNDSRNLEGLLGLVQRRDGKLIFTRNQGKEADLWIADGEGKNASALLAEPGFSVGPVTTPDGRYVVFNLQKDKSSGIWRTDADGKNAVRLTDLDADHLDMNPQVTPDGKAVIFQRKSAEDERCVLMKVPVTGGPAEPFYSAENLSILQPRISPDGKHLAYSVYDVRNFQKKLMIATLDGDRFGRIERELEYNLINQFTWSPDSKTLTVLTNRGSSQNIWRQPIDGSAPTQITDFDSGKILNFAWAADGKDLLIARGNTNNDLILIKDTERPGDSSTIAASRSGRKPTFIERLTSVFTDAR